MGKKNFSEAQKEFQKALDIEENSELYLNLGNAYASETKYEEALAAYTKAQLFDPNNAEIYFSIGSVYLLQDRLKKCIEAYNKAEALGYTNIRLYVNLAAIYHALGNRQLELRNYTKAIDKNPLIGNLYIKKALLLTELGKPDAALEITEEFRKLFPDAYEGYDLTARIYMMKGMPSEAIGILNEGITKFPKDINLKLSKAGLLIGRREVEASESVINELKEDPNYEQFKRAILMQEISVASLKEDRVKMKELLVEAVGLEKEGSVDEQARFMLMMVANISEDYALALEQAEKLDIPNSKSSYCISAMYYRGEILEKLGRADEAEDQFRKAAKRLKVLSLNSRTNFEIYVFRAMAHKHLKEYEKALELAEFIRDMQPEKQDGYVLLAEIYKDMGDEEKYREQYEIAKEKKPDLKER